MRSLACALLITAAAHAAPKKVAVLELRDPAALATGAVAYLTDRVRAAALGLPRDGFFVMTRENILDQLPRARTSPSARASVRSRLAETSARTTWRRASWSSWAGRSASP